MYEKSTCQYGKISPCFLLHLYNRYFRPTPSLFSHPFFAPVPHFFMQ